MTAKIDNSSFLEKELEFAKLEIANLHDDIHEWMDKCDALRAKVKQMDAALESLLIRCDDSDSAMYGTLSTSFVRDTVRIARAAL